MKSDRLLTTSDPRSRLIRARLGHRRRRLDNLLPRLCGAMFLPACLPLLFVLQPVSAETVTYEHEFRDNLGSTITTLLEINEDPLEVDFSRLRIDWEVIRYEVSAVRPAVGVPPRAGSLAFTNNPAKTAKAVTVVDPGKRTRNSSRFRFPNRRLTDSLQDDELLITDASGSFANSFSVNSLIDFPNLSGTSYGCDALPTIDQLRFVKAGSSINIRLLPGPDNDVFDAFGGLSVLSAVGPEGFTWNEPAPGGFGDAVNWTRNGPLGDPAEAAPGSSPSRRDTVIIDADGTFTVAGAPDNPLQELTVGNSDGDITLDMGGTYSCKCFGAEGRVELANGILEAGFAPLTALPSDFLNTVELSPGAALTVGAGAVLKTGYDIVTADGVQSDLPFARFATGGAGEEIEIVDGGKVIADGLRLSTNDTTSPAPLGTSVVVEGTDSEMSVLNLHAAEGEGSFAGLSVINGGKLRVGRQATFANGADSKTATIIEGEGSEMTGLADLVIGPLEIVVGNRGRATMDVRDKANVMLGGRLVIGAESSAIGTVGFSDEATLTIPSDFPSNVIVGDRGFASLGFAGDAQFLSSALDNGMPSELVIGKEAQANGDLIMEGAGLIPVATTFAATSVGLRGRGAFELLDGALFATGRLDIGTETDAEGTIEVDGPSTIFTIADLNFARIGVEGRGELVLKNGARFAVSNDPALPIDPTFVLDTVSIGLGMGEGIIRLESGAEFRAGVGRQDTDFLGNPLPGRLLSKVLVASNADGGTGRFTIEDSLAEMSVLSIGVRAARPTAPPSDGISRAGSVAVDSGELLAHDLIGIGSEGILRLSNAALVRTNQLALAPEADGGAFSPGAEVVVEDFGTHLDIQGSVAMQIGANTQLARMRIREEGALTAQEIDLRGASVLEISTGGTANIAIDALEPIREPTSESCKSLTANKLG